MPTVLEVLQKTTEFLTRKEIPQARLESELLLAQALGCKRLDLYLRFDQTLTEERLTILREHVSRRSKHEPLQYIAGRAGFLDFEVACDRRALIPRPETEELAELVFQKITTPPATALDLGTGTGVLAFAMARRWPDCRVTAVEASNETLALAQANAAALGLTERIQFENSRWPEYFSNNTRRFDVITANPPYLTESEWISAAPEVRDWEPRQALISGENGLADLHAIIIGAPAILAPGGLLALETGTAQHTALAEIALTTGAYARTESARDLSRRERFFFAWRT